MDLSPGAREPAVSEGSAAPILDHLATRAAQLYTLPTVAAEVLRLTGCGEVDRPALKACLENDPALTTRILKVVNSSLFGLTRKVTDLGQALALLGVKPLKMLVLGFTLPSQLVAGLEQEVLLQYWRHTLLKAAACRELSRRLFPARGEEAFTAGLLQDIGELVLIQQLGHSYIRFRHQVQKEQRTLREAEWLALGFDHVELSARLLAQWGMPPSLTAAVASPARSHQMDTSADRPLPQTLQVAELMACVLDSGNSAGMSGLVTAAHEELGLSVGQVQEILAGLTERAVELAEILSLDLPTSHLELSAAAHARLAETSAQMLECSAEASLLSDMEALQHEMQSAMRRQAKLGDSHPIVHGPADLVPARRGSEPLAAQEPLVPPSDQKLQREVAKAITRCRGQQNSLTLVLFEAHELQTGSAGGTKEAACPQISLQRLERALQSWSQRRGPVLSLGQNRFALLWEGCKRNQGFELARHVLDQAQESALNEDGVLPGGWILSAGLATLTLPPRNFPPHELVSAAQRCLSGAMLSGGNAVKSIEF